MILTKLSDMAKEAIRASWYDTPNSLAPYAYPRLSDEIQLEAGKSLFKSCLRRSLASLDLEALTLTKFGLSDLQQYDGEPEPLLKQMRDLEDQFTIAWGSPVAEVLTVLCPSASLRLRTWELIVITCVTNEGQTASDAYPELFHSFEAKVGETLDDAPICANAAWLQMLAEEEMKTRFLEPMQICQGCVTSRMRYALPNGVVASTYYFAGPDLPPTAVWVRACKQCNRFYHDMEAAQAFFADAYVHVPATESRDVVVAAFVKGVARHVEESFDDGSDEGQLSPVVAASV